MYLQPSIHLTAPERRMLFAQELQYGGHGQVALSGVGTFTPTNSAYVFYQIDFTQATTITSAAFRTVDYCGNSIYAVNPSTYNGFSFPAGYTWYAPLTSITLSAGKGIAYEYQKLSIDCT